METLIWLLIIIIAFYSSYHTERFCRVKSEEFYRLISRGVDHEMKELIQGHPWVVNKEHSGCLPLTYAMLMGRGNISMVCLLLAYGANPNKKESGSGGTVLHQAILSPHDGYLKVILANGGNPNIPNADGAIPIDTIYTWKNSSASKHKILEPYLVKRNNARKGKN